MNENKMNKWFTKILFTKEEIEKKCKELADWVNEQYKDSKDLIIVGILKGSIPFLAQLIKNVDVIHKIDFMTVSSFDGDVKSSGNLKIIMDLKMDIYGKDVLIAEDIVDSGLTLLKIYNSLKMRKPKSLRTLALLNKKAGRKFKFDVDKYGFNVPNKFLVGFGLDIDDKLRNIPFVGIFDKDKLNKI